MTSSLTLQALEPPSPTSSSSGTAIASAPSTAGRVPPNEYTHGPFEELDDPEDALSCPLQGYPELAKQIVDYPDFEAFQSFKDLSIKSLLYYQAELDDIRRDLHNSEWKDFRTSEGREYCVRADHLLQTGDSEDECAKRQFTLITKMRRVMKDYRAYNVVIRSISLLTWMFIQMRNCSDIHKSLPYHKPTLSM